MAVKLGNGNWAVKEDKLLAYNDNSGLFFNKEFDFSRGTSATYVGRDGLIKTAGIQPNVVTNGDFSNGSTDWTLGSDWTVADGKATYGANANGNALTQSNLFTVSGRYRVKFTISDIASGQGRIYMSNTSLSEVYLGLTYVNNQSYSFDFDATATNNLVIRGYNSGGGQSFSISNITVQQIETDTPRIDFTNDTKGHLLLEPSRTNIVTNSSNFAALSWATPGSTLTSVNIDLPDGTTGGFKISQNGGSSDRIQNEIGLLSNNHFFSLFVKGTSHTSDFAFRIRSLRGEDAKFNMNTNNEISYDSGTSTNYFIEEYENGWYRVGFESTVSNTISNYFQIFPDRTTDSFGSIYIWGAQVEEGSYHTSYIPTTGAASTRNADVCNNSGSAQDFNSEEGVLYAEIAYLSDTGTYRTISINDGTNNNMVAFENRPISNQIKAFVNVSGVNVMASTQALTNVKQFNKIAIKWKEDDFAWWVNGVQIHEDLSGSTFGSGVLNKLNFNNGIENFPFEGKVRNVQVFTEALTDEQLEKLTS